jgi:methylglutaconyl-CoA hydratase
VIDMTVAALVRTWEGGEAPEGIAAFFDKRAPAWRLTRPKASWAAGS